MLEEELKELNKLGTELKMQEYVHSFSDLLQKATMKLESFNC